MLVEAEIIQVNIELGESMFEKVKAAEERLRGHVHVTPVMSSQTLDGMLGAHVFFKCENFQKTGSFKFRGAFNTMSRLSFEQRSRGVVTYSSGNHAQAVASVGRILSAPAIVVMPSDAPTTKRKATEDYGAMVMEHDPTTSSRADIAEALRRKHGYTMIPPFDHPEVIAGQGTAALELLEAVALDCLLVPCGGGGLLSGCAIAAKHLSPRCRIIGIEPEQADDAYRSFYTRQLQTAAHARTIADGTRTPSLGRVTFPLILEYVDAMATVPETAIMEAVRFFFYRMKMVVEPSGALGLAALLNRSVSAEGRIGVMVSGGNMDSRTVHTVLNES